MLGTLADEAAQLRDELSGNTQLPADRLWRLARESAPDSQVARRLAINDGAPPDLVEFLAASGSSTVKEFVLWRPDLPRELLERLAADPDENVRRSARSTLERGDD